LPFLDIGDPELVRFGATLDGELVEFLAGFLEFTEEKELDDGAELAEHQTDGGQVVVEERESSSDRIAACSVVAGPSAGLVEVPHPDLRHRVRQHTVHHREYHQTLHDRRKLHHDRSLDLPIRR